MIRAHATDSFQLDRPLLDAMAVLLFPQPFPQLSTIAILATGAPWHASLLRTRSISFGFAIDSAHATNVLTAGKTTIKVPNSNPAIRNVHGPNFLVAPQNPLGNVDCRGHGCVIFDPTSRHQQPLALPVVRPCSWIHSTRSLTTSGSWSSWFMS